MKNDAVFNLLPEEELLAQLAEECSEAAKAALKLRRARDGVNPTPVSEEEAFSNFVMVEIMEQKLARWKYRLMKKEEVDVPEE